MMQRMQRLAIALSAMLLATLLVLPTASQVTAQQQPGASTQAPTPAPKSFLPPAGRQAAQPAATAPTGVYAWVSGLQRDYNRRLAAAIRDVKSSNPMLAVLSLAGLSFMYGVLHAAGPGHGKAVISSYVLASHQTVRRGIALSFLAALFQALSALVLVAVLLWGLAATGQQIKATEAWLETLSWAVVVLIGAWLVWRQIGEWRAERAAKAHHDHAAHHHHHGHHHAHRDHAHGGHGHDHAHAKDAHDCAACNHAHMPAPEQLQGAWSWRKALTLAAAIGIRPCTGAILVLVFAIGQGLAWAGVFATFAMALGTAITVSALAALAISSRDVAARLGGDGSRWAAGVRRIAGLGGAIAVTALGLMLFIGSLGPTAGL